MKMQTLGEMEAADPNGFRTSAVMKPAFHFVPPNVVDRLKQNGWSRNDETGEVRHPKLGDGFSDWMEAVLLSIDKANER